jgi:lysophospholipase L1-like esterase
MWQSLGRNLRGLITAVCLLAFALCAIEIGLRVDRYRSSVYCQPSMATEDLPIEEQLVAPSLSTWVELLPGAKISLKSPDTGDLVPFQTSSFGTRGKDPLVPKPKGLLRVLCLGDETTLAPELHSEETYPARLESLLTEQLNTKVEVINAGLPGCCPRIAALQLRHRLAVLEPDLVVLHFGMSDVAEDASIRRFVTVSRDGTPILGIHPATKKACQLKKPRLSDEFLIVQQVERQLARLWDREMPAAEESITDRRQLYRWTEDNPPDLDDEITSALAPLPAIQKLCQASGARLLVSCTPMPWQVCETASNTREARAAFGVPKSACWTSEAPFQRLAAACRERDIPSVIPLRQFVHDEAPDKLFLTHSPGLSPAGHQLYAEVLAEAIVGQGAAVPSDAAGGSRIVPSKAESLEWAR